MTNRILQQRIKSIGAIENACFFDKFIPSSMQGESCLVKTIYLVGLMVLLRFLFKLLHKIWDLWLAPKNLGSLLPKFGIGSYVVITGTTAGIGKQLAQDFASLGFNIVQVSRNAEKMK